MKTCRKKLRQPRPEPLETRVPLSVTPGVNLSVGTSLTTYRLALASTAEFTALNGGAAATQTVLAQIVQDVNRTLRKELAIQFELVPNNSLLVFTNGATDGYSNTDTFTMTAENQAVVDSVIGNANYDIGHVIGTRAFGGADGVGFVGVGAPGVKASGASSISDASFAEGILLHEMGHQLGALHTFNGTGGSCAFGREPSESYEPGSGSTIIAYPNICDTDNLTPDLGDATYYHAASFDAITSRLNGLAGVGSSVATGNNIPFVNAGPNYVIPATTPFSLSAFGFDEDGDALTYTWEQIDAGDADGQSLPVPNAADGAGPLFRSYAPSASPDRVFPRLQDILANTPQSTNKDEHLPTNSRILNFRVTARDNHVVNIGGVPTVVSGIASDDVALSVVNTGASFAVTSPNTSVVWTGGSSQVVSWNVAGTTGSGIDTSQVRILLSEDGGLTFPHVLAITANDGSELVSLPNLSTTQARIKVEAIGNIFFDIGDANFTLNANLAAPGIRVTETAGTLVEEGGWADTYLLQLNTTPLGDVDIGIFTDGETLVSLDGIHFSDFQSARFVNTSAQKVYVIGKQDDLEDGTRFSSIQHSVIFSLSPSYPFGMEGNETRVKVIDDELPPVLGVDYDFPCCGSLTPSNWESLVFPGDDATDIAWDDGRATTIDMTSTTFGTNWVFTGAPAARTIPKHAQSLKAVDGSSSINQPLTLTYSGLTPGQEYAVMVLGLDVDPDRNFSQTVTLTGAGGPLPSFIQNLKQGELMVNGETGSYTRTLLSYAQYVVANTAGQIIVGLTPNVGSDGVSLGGLAIAKTPESTPRLQFAAGLTTGERELHRSNGTAAGTLLTKNLSSSTSSSPRELTSMAGRLFFTASTNDGQVELHTSNGLASGTAIVTNLSGAVSSNPHELTVVGNTLFFAATGSDGQIELYKYVGASDGAVLVRNLSGLTSSDPRDLTAVGDKLYFSALLPSGERELFVSDGTSAGTLLVANLFSNLSADPRKLTAVNDELFFVATLVDGQAELHKYSPITGLQVVRNVAGTVSGAPDELTVVGNRLFFTANINALERELYSSDGTLDGTVVVRNLSGAASANPRGLTAVNNTLFFAATLADGQVELHKSDGTLAGTVLVRNLNSNASANPSQLIARGGKLYFTATSGAETELYTSDGTSAGTVIVRNLAGTASSNPSDLVVVGNDLFFTATTTTGERELHKSDGSLLGTVLVKNLSGSVSSTPTQLAAVSGQSIAPFSSGGGAAASFAISQALESSMTKTSKRRV